MIKALKIQPLNGPKLDLKSKTNLTTTTTVRNLLNNLTGLGIRASEWTNHKWNVEYSENTSRLRAFIPNTSARLVGISLPRTAWVKLNRLRTGVRRFHSSMHKWGLVPSPNCECGAA